MHVHTHSPAAQLHIHMHISHTDKFINTDIHTHTTYVPRCTKEPIHTHMHTSHMRMHVLTHCPSFWPQMKAAFRIKHLLLLSLLPLHKFLVYFPHAVASFSRWTWFKKRQSILGLKLHFPAGETALVSFWSKCVALMCPEGSRKHKREHRSPTLSSASWCPSHFRQVGPLQTSPLTPIRFSEFSLWADRPWTHS